MVWGLGLSSAVSRFRTYATGFLAVDWCVVALVLLRRVGDDTLTFLFCRGSIVLDVEDAACPSSLTLLSPLLRS